MKIIFGSTEAKEIVENDNAELSLDEETRQQIIQWVFNGKAGMSSMCMARAFLGVSDKLQNPYVPADADDFRRCLLLLEAAPRARAHISKLAVLSAEWSAIVDCWSHIESTFYNELGANALYNFGVKPTKTNELIHSIRQAKSLLDTEKRIVK